MRKLLLLTIGFFLSLMLVMSDVALAISASEIVSNFKKRYSTVKTFRADFEQTTLVAGKKRVANGKLDFQKPNLLRQKYFDLSNPEQTIQLIISDGQILWSYTPMVKQVTKQKLAQDESKTELLPGFGPSLENVEKNYSLSLVEDKLAEKTGVHVVEIKPKKLDEGSDFIFDALQVWIRDEDSAPVQFMYKNKKTEMVFIMSFKNVKINDNMEQSTFKFEIPAGVQVITVPEQ